LFASARLPIRTGETRPHRQRGCPCHDRPKDRHGYRNANASKYREQTTRRRCPGGIFKMALQAWQRAKSQDADSISGPPKTATIQASPEAAGNSLRLTDSPRLWRGGDRDEEKKDVDVIGDTSSPFRKAPPPRFGLGPARPCRLKRARCNCQSSSRITRSIVLFAPSPL